jgi:hypothetical protein
MHFSLTTPESSSRIVAVLRALFGWILWIPIFFFVLLVSIWGFLLSIYGFISLIISGNYPNSVFNFNTGLMVFSTRVQIFMYGLNDSLPSFDFENTDDDVFELSIDRQQSYSRLSTLIIALFGVIITFAQSFWLSVRQIICVFGAWIAFWVVFVSGKYPEFISEWIAGTLKYEIEIRRYTSSMDQKYPGNKILIIVSIILFILYSGSNFAQIQDSQKQIKDIRDEKNSSIKYDLNE